MGDDELKLTSPLHLVTGGWDCWRCGSQMEVVAILCENTAEPDMGSFILSSTATLPIHVVEFVQRRCPTFRLTFSKTVRAEYYANNCPNCGVISGDFFLHSEPGAPFFPTEEDEARSLTLEQIPLSEPVIIDSGCGYGTGELILQFAKRINRDNDFAPKSVTEQSDAPKSPVGGEFES
ncbi:hypothetical protein [Neorhodopirellula pilleata]|uniref:Uncharacterized protein n=1 Tax=Neorhodopirellula pilleata TaxID=2714738 RepID=A0A5C6A6L1_9BACT|nr:hypothetical protein [Neorhodopirellula pilleata]TWT94918.1 hypothetical protein Pla100_34920 [Neorhodopirellula pilleata]